MGGFNLVINNLGVWEVGDDPAVGHFLPFYPVAADAPASPLVSIDVLVFLHNIMSDLKDLRLPSAWLRLRSKSG